MRPRYVPPFFDISRMLLVVLALGAVSGWITFFIANQSATETESQLRGQVTSLHQMQLNLVLEKNRMQAAQGDLEQLRSQVAKLRQEADLLAQARDLARAELVTATTGMKDLLGRLSHARSDVAETGSVNTKAIDSQQLVTATAQRALARLGHGPLKADGVVGPGTRRAVEAFQRANNLYVTGELDAPTLRRLTPDPGAAH